MATRQPMIALLAALTVALVGCSTAGQTPPTPTSTTTATSTTAPVALTDQDRVFLDQLQSDEAMWQRQFSFVPTDVLTGVGHRACTELRSDWDGAIQEAVESGIDRDAVVALLDAAIVAYCPDLQ
ncbi:hypothetical protein SEA_CRACKLEWINK_119 [Mycobacterium phage Cracklewink]|uniref:DUF732 domain-containing protein n=1 Tax=Mycobacterium phage Bipper TaxID=1805457 RepID=A0A142F2P7_9CAUD|nr:hypothetical protein KCH39_gp058 [Mycobacterium phage Bipper]AMQ67054.1 hypothetical protein SEA_BIPPER_119 [Mycobacterium phage Bipper]QDF19405.1 hypothetical protein SEA_CRACKLEWINK_119 [Mycobacterium phage Cracklewink]